MKGREKRLALQAALAAVTLAGSVFLNVPPAAEAADKTVSVQLPDFPVTVDGRPIDSTTLEYPLITYRDITYFPMTWSVGQGMGLRINWSEEQGLQIAEDWSNKSELKMETGGSYKQGRTYAAQIVDSPVIVEGERIDNTSEPYPLLKMGDITYFPMTWHFAHDKFVWDTSWSDDTGFSIRTMPKPYFAYDAVYDDENFLYVPANDGGGIFRIGKNLQGMPLYMNKEQAADIWTAYERRTQLDMPEAADLTVKDDKLLYKGTELLGLQPFYDKNKAYYDQNKLPNGDVHSIRTYGSAIPLDGQTTLVSATVYYLADTVPAPYTPREMRTYLVRDGKASEISGFAQSIAGYSRAEGGLWIWSFSPNVVTTANSNSRGLVMWIGSDGQTKSFNDVLGAQNVSMLHASGNEAVVEAYTLFGTDQTTEGFFQLHTDGTYEKISDLVSSGEGERKYRLLQAYVSGGVPYVIDSPQNRIINVATGQSREWWDYELMHAVNDATGS